MKGSTLVLTILGLGFGVQILIVGVILNSKPAGSKASTIALGKTGFVKVALPEGAVANEVLIVGPNCNRPEGVRTRSLVSSLAKLNIPHRQTDSISFSSDSFSSDNGLGNMTQLNNLMQGEAPIVFINGKGKSNPAIDEVLTEYKLATKL